ncbi:MAG TPA: metallopeptidase TldD-related protein [Candidatus Cloacimonadota bacterium]|jgi:predicted Zn-dependent protease|nr:metallopeptidase TldD-related protein [Candidatus Cloacimonadota bacterium]HOG31655.1 metallopeptidase TldD-related protein [Candidatus Cloacimonadota bacterium]HOR59497.1 metallopeptidase TldD-related protein [Candidatus Cloacimonadota bacterium]HPB09438.1 metallopeptidase TldD-related protein [Candidatus Cloacimonadota bacterium]HPL23918.1 metallopeptidase TldD-related protein [Candidatus Cloacimonadota bacterium]
MNKNFELISDYIRKHCQADDYVLRVNSMDSHETRFAQNRVTQHIAGGNLSVDLTVSFGEKSGSCSVNQGDQESLDYLIRTAEDMARLNRPDPEFMPSVGAQELPQTQNMDAATRDLAPARMVEIVQQAIDKATAYGASVSGMTEKHYWETLLNTKNGFVGTDSATEFGHSMTLKKDNVETKVSYSAKDMQGFSLEGEFAQLASQAESLKTMKDFDPCQIAVILRPSALEELLWFMGWMMNRRQSDEGLTPFSGQIGQPFFGGNFSLKSTLARPELYAPAFDHEGVASRELTWVENGVLRNMPTNRYWAKLKGLEPMSAYNAYMPGSHASEEEMMQMVPRGLIINRFWYIRTVDAKTGELTGMTRDGVLYFEDGKVRNAVNNLRFNEIPHLATRRIVAMGESGLASLHSCMPTTLIDGFTFVDKTSF